MQLCELSQQAEYVTTIEAEKFLTTSVNSWKLVYVLEEISIHRACRNVASHLSNAQIPTASICNEGLCGRNGRQKTVTCPKRVPPKPGADFPTTISQNKVECSGIARPIRLFLTQVWSGLFPTAHSPGTRTPNALVNHYFPMAIPQPSRRLRTRQISTVLAWFTG